MDRRIFGLENEYGVTCTFRGQRRLSPDEVARYLFRRVVSWGRSSNVFLAQRRQALPGRRHPSRVRHAGVRHRAPTWSPTTRPASGSCEGLLVDAERRLHEEGIAGDVYLFKNNTDSAGNSYGCHENYLVARHGEFSRLADVLIPFLVTRQMHLRRRQGAADAARGGLLREPAGRAHLGGRRPATTRSRPIINTRDEPHADAERYRRLHVIVGDSNMTEATTLLKVGATDLVLRMIEAGMVMRDLTLENPIRAIREVSHDITGRRKVRLANGREASRAGDPAGVPRPRRSDFAERRGGRPGRASGCSSCGSARLDAIETRRPRPGRPRDRLGHQVPADRAVPRPSTTLPMSPPAGRPDRPRLPRHPPAAAASTTCWSDAARSSRVVPATWTIFEAEEPSPQTTRARLRGEFIRRRPRSSAATSPSTGCTSSSTTRRSARCCARTRSARTTTGWRS